MVRHRAPLRWIARRVHLLDADAFRSGRPGTLRDQLRVAAFPAVAGMSIRRRRGRRTATVSSPAARASTDRTHVFPPGDDDGFLRNIAADATNVLPRYRLVRHLKQATGLLDQIEIDHTVEPLGIDHRLRPRPANP